jgi:uncharacterized phage protein (TIGR01671 family)
MQQNLDKLQFRVWDKGSSNVKAQMIYCSGFSVLDGNIIRLYDEYGHIIDSCCATIQNLMQSTGLKDKNGKLVFEGDVVQEKYENHLGNIEYENHLVIFKNSCFQFAIQGDLDNLEIMCSMKEQEDENLDVEIIGNIYEHSFLLDK